MEYKHIFDYAREVDTILIVNGGENSIDKNFFYLTQAKSGVFEGSMLIVSPSRIKILTSILEEEAARDTGLEVITASKKKDIERILQAELKNVDVVGLNYDSITLSDYTDLSKMIPDKRFVDVSVSIQEARRIKTPEELKKIREAAKIASESFESVLGRIKEGITETELASELVYQMLKHGASEPSFSSIVAFGSNSSLPHYSPGNRKLKRNEFVLMDFGALFERYCSDVTRTVVFGKASEEQRDVYSTVKNAQEKSMNAIRENVNGKDIDKIARDVIDSTKYKDRFIHSLGHGLGMDVHDHPALSPGVDLPLKENMVVTVEPGIYIPKFGGVRIEDDVVVKKNGYERITTAPRDLIEIS
ncbi:MAG: Xaa-Pro peptidase family protein [Candidatus Thermoplasmatota archaeon]|jgi:Xaa-Pro dipeptidase|nr:Xaa-Pro peptidase family protein [Candidatus Thermoplasmatota archaeon]MCL5800789.1 Xaa-Pro peptidase family protein [Candidatus Thermoplasmatota archaeon]